MKLTTARLKKLIREELDKMNEISGPSDSAKKSVDDLQMNWTSMIKAKLAEMGIGSGSVKVLTSSDGSKKIVLNLDPDHNMYEKFMGPGRENIVATVPNKSNILAKHITVTSSGKKLGIDKMLADPTSTNKYLK